MSTTCVSPTSVAGTCQTASAVAASCQTPSSVTGSCVTALPTACIGGDFTVTDTLFATIPSDCPGPWTVVDNGTGIVCGMVVSGNNVMLLDYGTCCFTNGAITICVTATKTFTAASLQFRLRTGVPSLGGYAEYTGAGLNYYLKQTLGGSFGHCTYNLPGCSSGTTGATSARNYGSGDYDAVTLAFVSSMYQQVMTTTLGVCTPGVDSGGPTLQTGPAFAIAPTDNNGVTVTTATSVTRANTGSCFFNNPLYSKYTGSESKTLSVPDTESNAKSRLWPTLGSFGSYAVVSPILALASETVRAAASWTVTQQQYKATASGVPAGTWTAVIAIYRRVIGVSSYVLFTVLQVPVSLVSSTLSLLDQDIPSVSGYETYVASVAFSQ